LASQASAQAKVARRSSAKRSEGGLRISGHGKDLEMAHKAVWS